MNKIPYNETKTCDVHNIEMPLRESNGNKFYSHVGYYQGVRVWCSGYGWKNKERFGGRYLPDDEVALEQGWSDSIASLPF